MNHARRRHERLRILGVDAAFHGVAGESHLALFEAQAGAGRNANLFLDDIDAGHHFGDRMLHLHAGVHFHEEEVALLIQEEFKGARVGVLHGARRVDDHRAHLPAHLVGDRDRGRLFQQFLVTTLDRTLALAQVNHVAVVVAENLEFDMAR